MQVQCNGLQLLLSALLTKVIKQLKGARKRLYSFDGFLQDEGEVYHCSGLYLQNSGAVAVSHLLAWKAQSRNGLTEEALHG